MFDINKWADEFTKCAIQSINVSSFIELISLENHNDFELSDEANKDFGIQLCMKRAKSIGLELSTPAMLYIRTITSSPADIVMYLSVLRTRTKKADIHILDAIFPDGRLSSKDLETMWDKQKGHNNKESCDNCLDNIDWDSFVITNQIKPLMEFQ